MTHVTCRLERRTMEAVRHSVSILAASLLLVHYGQAENIVTCDAGTVYIGEPSNITCHFNTDIKTNKLSISVSIVKSNKDKSKEAEVVDVLQCSWPPQTRRPECLVEEGYGFDFVITDRVTVDIPAATAVFAGAYSCHIVPPDGTESQACELLVVERPTLDRASVTTPYPRELQGPHTGSSSDSNNGQTTAILVLLIILILFVAGVSVLYIVQKTGIHNRIPRTRKRTAIPHDDEDPAESLPLAEPHETKITAEVHTQTEAAGLCDSGTDCPTDLPTEPEPLHKELPEKAAAGDSVEAELESQPVDSSDKPSKSKISGKRSLFKKSKKDKAKS